MPDWAVPGGLPPPRPLHEAGPGRVPALLRQVAATNIAQHLSEIMHNNNIQLPAQAGDSTERPGRDGGGGGRGGGAVLQLPTLPRLQVIIFIIVIIIIIIIIMIYCSMLAVNTTCGRDTAVFTKHFLDRMATPLNQVSINLGR